MPLPRREAPPPTDEPEARHRVLERVRAYPGLHLREIAAELGMETNHARYHLRALERSGRVSSRREAGYRRFFPRETGPIGLRDAVPPAHKELLGLLRRPVPLLIVVLLLDRGEMSTGAMRQRIRLSPSTIRYYLQELEAAGVVAGRDAGRERAYWLVDPEVVRGHLATYPPPDALVAGFLEAWEALDL